ncbi:MAG: pyruvate ferredoxin oxidoreductase [Prevotella sp.]|nr:pyruvate ferredoxin oxidoreductase [Prevotella sp.]
MDYKYIEQLLERYWNCETSLSEEEILRTFFSQKDVPVSLLKYKDLFRYQQEEKKTDVLGDDFDARLLTRIEEPQLCKVRRINVTHGLMPLFKAAAVVAIFLTLGNAAQVAFREDNSVQGSTDVIQGAQDGKPVALGDSVKTDTINNSLPDNTVMLK